MVEHNVQLELYWSGAWHAVPALIRDRITYTRGTKGFKNDTDPSEGSATIDNTSGQYAPRSVLSGLYGLIGQNTPVRLSADSSVRMTAEVASWNPQRPVKGSSWTPIELAGILRRIGIGDDPIRSALTRAAYATAADGLVAYWPCEDGENATAAANLVKGANTLVPVHPTAVAFAKLDSALVPRGVQALPALTGTGMSAFVTATSTTSWRVEFLLCVESGSLGASDSIRGIRWETGGGITLWQMTYASLLGDFSIGIQGTSPFLAGTPFGITFQRTDLGDPHPDDGLVHHFALDVSQTDSTNMAYTITMDGVVEASGNNGTGVLLGTQQIGAPYRMIPNPDDDPRVLTAGGVGVWSPHPAAPISYQAVIGYPDEPSATRFLRFCAQEGYTGTVVGTEANTVHMGPQTTDPLLQQFDVIASTDDAAIFETRGSSGLTMRTGASKQNQTEALAVSYLGQVQPPLRPVVGDAGIRNDVTASNPDQTKARVTQETGPRNVQTPSADPQGVGRYTTDVTVNVPDLLTLADEAGWRLNQGTYDGTWYASVTVDLDAAPGLVTAVNAVDIGDVVRISDLPAEDTISDFAGVVIAIGEELPVKRRLVTFWLVPADPYRVGVLAADTGDTAALVGHVESDTAVLTVAAAAGATTFTVTASPAWTTTADDFPQDVVVGAQRVTLSGVSGSTFTVSTAPGAYRLVYGVAAGAVVSVYQPIIPTLVD